MVSSRLALAALVSSSFGCLDLDALTTPNDTEVSGDAGMLIAPPPEPPVVMDPPLPPPPPPAPPPTCGVVGMECCMPGSTCSSGVCLRGTCAAFGGSYGVTDSCAPACRSRNAYTAGCSCPAGFDATPAMAVAGECEQAMAPTTLTLCTAAETTTDSDWAGAFLEVLAAPSCGGGCSALNPYTGDCSCPTDATPIPMRVAAMSACGTRDAALTFCLRAGADTITFAGGYQMAEDESCATSNPATGTCDCPEGAEDRMLRALPTALHICTK